MKLVENFRGFQSILEKQVASNMKVLCSDNGAEFETYWKKQGIIHQKTNPYTPAQTGRSERLNRFK